MVARIPHFLEVENEQMQPARIVKRLREQTNRVTKSSVPFHKVSPVPRKRTLWAPEPSLMESYTRPRGQNPAQTPITYKTEPSTSNT